MSRPTAKPQPPAGRNDTHRSGMPFYCIWTPKSPRSSRSAARACWAASTACFALECGKWSIRNCVTKPIPSNAASLLLLVVNLRGFPIYALCDEKSVGHNVLRDARPNKTLGKREYLSIQMRRLAFSLPHAAAVAPKGQNVLVLLLP
jgi:hypothetical protein